MKIAGRIVNTAALNDDEIAAMLALMHEHYANVSEATFRADLVEKSWVILLHDADCHALCGFSTQMVLDERIADRPIKALFSGDTIIDRRYWGDPTLARLGGQLALSLIDEYPADELYWFLISGGYKTYRFLPVFFREFYPRYDVPTPGEVRRLIYALAERKFPGRFDAASGVVRATATQYHLRDGLADVTPERLRDPHVRFFVEQNPGHMRGDELCCLARLCRDNFTEASFRVLGSSPSVPGDLPDVAEQPARMPTAP